jgi:hypothetical protein
VTVDDSHVQDLIRRSGMKIAEGDTSAVVELDEIAEVVDEVVAQRNALKNERISLQNALAKAMAERDALKAVVETLVELWDAAGRDGDGEKIVSETLFVALVDAGRNALALGERDG